MNILKEIKENNDTCDIPIIICSSIGDKETIKRTLLLGAYDYFEKPFNDMAIDFGFSLKVTNALHMKRKTDHVLYLRNHDVLTGLGTRQYFESELQSAIDKLIMPLCVVIIDINGLKVINDAYGHDAGDNILREISDIFTRSDLQYSCAARWGSDEIVMLFPFLDRKSLNAVITDIKALIDTNKTSDYDISFGWAIEDNDISNAKYLVQKAEDNLFSNKILEVSSVRRNMIESIIKTLHQKNPREEEHSRRVSFISEKIAIELGFSDYEIKRVKLAGLMHDIGKITVSEDILNKPGKLNAEEWQQIKSHPEHGFTILSTSIDTMEIANAVLAHHERWDGRGYPKGISSDSIPIMARIIAVADTFDAITSTRTYRSSRGEDEAMDEIVHCSGSQFDPIVADAFLRYMKNK